MTVGSPVDPGCRICGAAQLSSFAPFGRPEYMVIHCDACGHESIRPLPSRAELEAMYSGFEVTVTDEQMLRFLVERTLAFLRYFVANTALRDARASDHRFLDVGFGNGAGLLAAAKLGFHAYGTEIDSASIARMRDAALHYAVAVDCTATDIRNYRKDLSFDVVRTSNVIELVLDPREFVAEIAARQTTGGHLIVECQNNDGAFWRIKNLLRRRYGRMNHYNSLKIGELISGFTKESVAILLRGAGYRVLRCQDYGIGDRMLDLEKIVWYPSVFAGVRLALQQRSAYPFLKSLIPVFDRTASMLAGRGTYLSVWAQKT